MPSRLSTPRPPSLPRIAAVSGETTPSIAEASSGSSKRYGPSIQLMSMSSGSRVRRDGTIAMSSNPYARRPFLPRPISISKLVLQQGRGLESVSLHFRGDLQIVDRDLAEQALDLVAVD